MLAASLKNRNWPGGSVGKGVIPVRETLLAFRTEM
ncbi:hypothetical protein RSal33209_0049 [Renibacterium salmoninarum ATCC 33209]|uniref:Uncharacterized protein n=1 Tax=Renibacterium salmoninarum (strain ATCC 33209 / DSM 20767 / JCM 11484 / NBRC 15589 / NCIMB 2235) TaxID=288705 RepID=A9WLM6_RENSM|nr:hypothetical protein RSal33209_0049 [Renibacterium salmoninarum ATCC 33209]